MDAAVVLPAGLAVGGQILLHRADGWMALPVAFSLIAGRADDFGGSQNAVIELKSRNIVARIDGKTGDLIQNPDIISRGFVYLKENKRLIEMNPMLFNDPEIFAPLRICLSPPYSTRHAIKPIAIIWLVKYSRFEYLRLHESE